MVNVINKVKVYENNGVSVNDLSIVIKSNWKTDRLVDIVLPDAEETLTVATSDLLAAIQNATNTARY